MRFSRILALLIIAAMVLSACGPAVAPAADEVTPSGQRFLLSLPRLTIDFDSQGRPISGGFVIADVERLTCMQFQSIALTPFYVDWMTYTNVQHIELAHASNGIFLYANGEALPHLAWDSESLGNMASVMGVLNVPYSKLIGMLVPVIERTGLDLVVTFPLQEGAEAVALRDAGTAPQVLVAEDVASTLITHIDVDYDESGVPMMAGLSSRDILDQTGYWLPVELTPETIDLVQAYGIEEFRVMTAADGIFIMVNGAALPHIAWNTTALNSGVGLYAQMNPDSPYIELANLLVGCCR